MWTTAIRTLATVTVIGVVAFLSMTTDDDSSVTRSAAFTSSVQAAPASVSLDGLTFSSDVDGQGRPRDERIEFDSSTERIWVSFAYHDFTGEGMSYLVRANGEDWRWGDLDCCNGSNGRYAFPLERNSGKDLGGAAYDVFVYANNAEVGHGGFGVKGTGGFDHNDDNDNS